MHTEPDSIQQVWAALVVEELVRHGITMFYASPGSRSTPLILAAGRHPGADVHMHIDERGSAFMALGHARMTGAAAAWLTTSGTAVANGHPAVVEARLEGLPMILLTADRPPELRETSANQTIRQVGLFGADVVWSFDLPVPTRDIAHGFVLTTIAEAVRQSRKGPVHLNFMFREPLYAGGSVPACAPESRPGSAPWTAVPSPHVAHVQKSVAEHAAGDLGRLLAESRRPLLLLGRMPVTGRAILPETAPPSPDVDKGPPPRWPVLIDVASQYRSFDAAVLGCPVPHFDAILHDYERWPELAPDLVLQIGRPPVSKRWQQFLQSVRPPIVIVADSVDGRIDPGHLVSHRWDVSPHALVAAIASQEMSTYMPSDSSWAARWMSLSRAASTRIPFFMDAAQGAGAAAMPMEQACVCAAIDAFCAHSAGLDEAHPPLVLGNSLTVRHADTFMEPAARPLPVVVNRGASGIDGQVSTAIGAARAAGTRALLIVGDLTLLHDLNALAAARDLAIVVINNDGGGIFCWLPVSADENAFTPLFATPHGLTFKAAAELFGLSFEAPGSAEEVAAAVRRGMAATGGVLIEVRTDRDATLASQKELLRGVTHALRQDIPLS